MPTCLYAKQQDADYRGLSESPEWIAASALIDGLIQWGLVQEITRRVFLAEKTTELFAMTQYCRGYDCEVDVRYNTQPIDRQFVCELNKVLLPTDSVMLRLDVGVRPYLITGMHLNDIEVLTRLLHQYGISPKYFASVTKEEEASAKQISQRSAPAGQTQRNYQAYTTTVSTRTTSGTMYTTNAAM